MIWHRKGSGFWCGPYEICLSTRGFQLWHHGGTAESFYVLGRELRFEDAKKLAALHKAKEAAVSGAEPAAASVTVVAESGVPS